MAKRLQVAPEFAGRDPGQVEAALRVGDENADRRRIGLGIGLDGEHKGEYNTTYMGMRTVFAVGQGGMHPQISQITQI
ncbi:MAG: hypothetical protein ACYC6L_14150 [Anaerolineae bacterium]